MVRTVIKRTLLTSAALGCVVLFTPGIPRVMAAYTPGLVGPLTGDCTTPSYNSATPLATLSVTTCTKSNGTSFASMAFQTASAVAITGGSINGTTIGNTTAAALSATTGAFSGALTGLTGAFTGLLSSQGYVGGTRVITSGASATFGANDELLAINKTTGSATAVAGPATPVIGQNYILKDAKGDAATNNITFTPGSGVTIDGASSYVLTVPYQSIQFRYLTATTVAIL